jgi:hypothetical protein
MRTKQQIQAVFKMSALAVVLAATGCGGGSSGGSSMPTTTVSGMVTDASGQPVEGAVVVSGSATATTRADGQYQLAVAAKDGIKVEVNKAGYVTTLDVVNGQANQTIPLNFVVKPVGKSNTLTSLLTASATAVDAQGHATVVFDPSSIVDAAGQPVDQAVVNVTMTTPTEANYADQFPGMFVGVRDGADAPIESFGFVTVDILCGVPVKACQLGAGKTAQLAIPVVAGADPKTPKIELWLLDPAVGKWLYKGDAVRDETVSPVVYRAQVNHFSTYNLDRPIAQQTELKVTVTRNNAPAANAAVVVKSTSTSGAIWEGRGTTAADGTYTFPVIPQGSVSAQAMLGNLQGVGYAYEVVSEGKATMSIPLMEMITRQVTFYRMVGGVKTPVAGASVQGFGESQGGGGAPFSAVTGRDGKVTLKLPAGAMFYGVSANVTIDGVMYSGFANGESVNTIPAEIELKAQTAS